MACAFDNDEDKRRKCQRAVRVAIKRVDGGNRTVTQGTYIDQNGLNHRSATRRRYGNEINAELAQYGGACQLSAAGKTAVADMSLSMVADVTAAVMADL
jgi:hypothetical protein